jgi:hypothetical protein
MLTLIKDYWGIPTALAFVIFFCWGFNKWAMSNAPFLPEVDYVEASPLLTVTDFNEWAKADREWKGRAEALSVECVAKNKKAKK